MSEPMSNDLVARLEALAKHWKTYQPDDPLDEQDAGYSDGLISAAVQLLPEDLVVLCDECHDNYERGKWLKKKMNQL
jgi:hypothetical protein